MVSNVQARCSDSKTNWDICTKMCQQLNTPRIFLCKKLKTCNWNPVGLVGIKSGRLWCLCETVKTGTYSTFMSLMEKQRLRYFDTSQHNFCSQDIGLLTAYNIKTLQNFNIRGSPYTRWHKKTGNIWKTQQKLKKSKKKNYWQKLNHYNLPFKRQ